MQVVNFNETCLKVNETLNIVIGEILNILIQSEHEGLAVLFKIIYELFEKIILFSNANLMELSFDISY